MRRAVLRHHEKWSELVLVQAVETFTAFISKVRSLGWDGTAAKEEQALFAPQKVAFTYLFSSFHSSHFAHSEPECLLFSAECPSRRGR